MNKKIMLPKTDDKGVYYLSYSQINTWKRSKRDYIRQYFLGEKDDNAGLQKYGDFGHKVGEAFENNDFSAFEADEIEFLKTIPKYDEFEREIRLNMDGFFVKGYIDTSSKPEQSVPQEIIGKNTFVGDYIKKIADYKTGDISKKKGDYESEDYNQVEIYAAALEQEFGEAPDDCKVFLIGRSGNAFAGEKLELTKEFVTIEREITPEILQRVKDGVQQVAEEISDYYQAFLKLNKVI